MFNYMSNGRPCFDGHFGPVYANSFDELETKKQKVISDLTDRLGRPPTKTELMQGYCDLEDTRSYDQKVAAQNWKPVIQEKETKYDWLRKQLAPQADPYKGMSRAEAMQFDIDQMEKRELGQKADDAEHLAQLKKDEPTIKRLKDLLIAERWNPKSSVMLRDMLQRTITQLETPRYCKETANKMIRGVEHVLNERASQQQTAMEAEMKAMKERMDQIKTTNFDWQQSTSDFVARMDNEVASRPDEDPDEVREEVKREAL